jgi:hypothetical protein
MGDAASEATHIYGLRIYNTLYRNHELVTFRTLKPHLASAGYNVTCKHVCSDRNSNPQPQNKHRQYRSALITSVSETG